jgi:hypothetical protein
MERLWEASSIIKDTQTVAEENYLHRSMEPVSTCEWVARTLKRKWNEEGVSRGLVPCSFPEGTEMWTQSQTWWYMPVSQLLRRLRQEDHWAHVFKASVGNYYGLNLKCLPKAGMLKACSQCSSVQKWGLWEVTGSWGLWPHPWIYPFMDS